LLSPLLPLPPPAFASPVVGWLLHCFPPSAFVITRHHATINALAAGHFCLQLFYHRHRRRCRCHCRRAATTSTATAATIVELTVVHCQRKKQQQHHHQCTNGSTKVKTFISLLVKDTMEPLTPVP
jgi:hypothetical protein